MKKNFLLPILVALAAVAAFRYVSNAEDTLPVLAIQAPAPEISLTDADGVPFRLSEQRGKIVVLEWTNPDCPFVQRVYRDQVMTALQKRWTEQGVVWKTINSSHFATADQNREWAKTYALPSAILDDQAGVVGKAYGARTTPHLFVIDKSGALAYQGALDSDAYGDQGSERIAYLDQALQALTAGTPVQAASTKPYGCSVKYKWGG